MMKKPVLLVLCLLSAVSGAAQRLPRIVFPENYRLTIAPDFSDDTFHGQEVITASVQRDTREVRLNAVDLEIEEASIDSAAGRQSAVVTVGDTPQQIVLTVGRPIPTGTAKIDIAYRGRLNDRLRGFYLGHANGRKYAATQFESTDARRAFPSFDEPNLKATFDISLVVDRADVGFSNGLLVSDTPGPGPDRHTLRFATTPRMSTYLVAFVVGDFRCLEGGADGVPIRVCATPDKVELGRFALSASEFMLRYFDEYFGIRYPFEKLDHIAIPDFEAGAMENTGAIVYRETALLADTESASVKNLQSIAEVVSHEMSHQWFGDLVTMEWWNDIWLNEGFASWMETKPIEAWKPAWNIPMEVLSSTGWALGVDTLRATRPISAHAETPQQIDQLFDGISYNKGASVLRMVESYLGDEEFRKGVNLYLSRHAYGNASSDDFSAALSEATGKPVDIVMTSFVTQPGIPLLSISTRCDNGHTLLSLKQERFVIGEESADQRLQRWTLPVCFSPLESRNEPNRCEILSSPESSFTLDGCSQAVLINPGGQGYYLTRYDDDDLAEIRSVAETRLTPRDRFTLLRDQWYLVRDNRLAAARYLDLMEAMKGERDPGVLAEILTRIDFTGRYLVPEEQMEAYHRWVRNYLAPAVREIGWIPKAGESPGISSVRGSLLYTYGWWGRDRETSRKASRLARVYLHDRKALPPEIAGDILKLAARSGDAALYEQLLAASRTAKTPQESKRFLYALASFTNPSLVARTIDLGISEVRNQDSPRLLSNAVSSEGSGALAWDAIKARWDDVTRTVPPTSLRRILGGARSFCTKEAKHDLGTFLQEHPVAYADRTVAQLMESIGDCIELRAQQQASVSLWLSDPGR